MPVDRASVHLPVEMSSQAAATADPLARNIAPKASGKATARQRKATRELSDMIPPDRQVGIGETAPIATS